MNDNSIERPLGLARNNFGTYGPNGVIGRITRHDDATLIETGLPLASGGWEKTSESGHILVTPRERDELIDVLISHRPGSAQAVQVGTEVDGAEVMAVTHFEGTGDPAKAQAVILAFRDGGQEYIVGTVGTDGVLRAETVTRMDDFDKALNAFAVRSTDRVYAQVNRPGPHLTFGYLSDRDRLKDR